MLEMISVTYKLRNASTTSVPLVWTYGQIVTNILNQSIPIGAYISSKPTEDSALMKLDDLKIRACLANFVCLDSCMYIWIIKNSLISRKL